MDELTQRIMGQAAGIPVDQQMVSGSIADNQGGLEMNAVMVGILSGPDYFRCDRLMARLSYAACRKLRQYATKCAAANVRHDCQFCNQNRPASVSGAVCVNCGRTVAVYQAGLCATCWRYAGHHHGKARKAALTEIRDRVSKGAVRRGRPRQGRQS
jgi:hypothetical protein